MHSHGASQPVAGGVVDCLALHIVSFNFGIEQQMIESARAWGKKHSVTLRDLLDGMGNTCSNDFIFGSEMGGVDQGFEQARISIKHIVNDALPGAACASSGAYLSVWNIKTAGAAAVVDEGTWSSPIGQRVHMRWQAFDITLRDASQLACKKVGFIVGNMHIPIPSKGKAPSRTTKRSIVKLALTHLALTVPEAWRLYPSEDFPVLRILVGDCNLEKDEAANATQDVDPAPISHLQRTCGLEPGGASQPAEQLALHGVDMSSHPPTLLEDPPSQEVPQSELCMICICQPREIRLCCGHLFACAGCLSKLTTCALCREPITTGYYIRPHLADDEDSLLAAGYISSGSETYASMDDGKCGVLGCSREAKHLFHCSRCSTADELVSKYLCSRCMATWACPVCQHPVDQKDVVTLHPDHTSMSDSEEDLEEGPSPDPDPFSPIPADIEERCFGKPTGEGCNNLATSYFRCDKCGWGRCVVCRACIVSWSCPGCSSPSTQLPHVLTEVYDGSAPRCGALQPAAAACSSDRKF